MKNSFVFTFKIAETQDPFDIGGEITVSAAHKDFDYLKTSYPVQLVYYNPMAMSEEDEGVWFEPGLAGEEGRVSRVYAIVEFDIAAPNNKKYIPTVEMIDAEGKLCYFMIFGNNIFFTHNKNDRP